MTLMADFYASIVTVADGRVYPGNLPQEVEYPAVVYGRVGGSNVNTLTGDADLDNAAMQVDCFAATSAEAEALAESIRVLLKVSSTFKALNTSKRGPTYSTEENPPLYWYSYDFSVWR